MSLATKNTWKRILGIFLVIFGIIALIIPFFPFAWVALVGFELLGLRALFWGKLKNWRASRREHKNGTQKSF